MFLLMRDLCLALLGQTEQQLPLSKVENSVHLEDVLDLSKCDIKMELVHLFDTPVSRGSLNAFDKAEKTLLLFRFPDNSDLIACTVKTEDK